ncbi:AAA family ATPase [Marinifilum sp. JC120]|nr:AAA family ATPase [Marinifilum sp. JC120]
MTSQFPHLCESAVSLMALSEQERIAKIQTPVWIGYPVASKILARLEELVEYPKSHRMPNLLITGDTNNGKTMLVNRFCKAHPRDDNPDGEAAIIPVLYIQAPPTPEEGRFYDNILENINAPFRPQDRASKKAFQAVKLLKAVGVKLLIIDEIQQILAGSMKKQRAFLNVIKGLGNELKIPIVGVGTREADRAIQTDLQLSNRFDAAFLPRWRLNANYIRLLLSFERILPLAQPSGLDERGLSTKILSMSEGYIGEIARILADASVFAIKSGHERIDVDILGKINWISPSQRRYRSEFGG